MPNYNIPVLTAKRAANPKLIVHQAIALLFNAPNQTMTEQNFLNGLRNLPKPPKRPNFTLNSMMSTAPHQYGDILVRKRGMIEFNPAWLIEIQKYQW